MTYYTIGIRTIGISRSTTHTVAMEAHYLADLIIFSHGQFWSQICRKITCIPPHPSHPQNVWNLQRLDGWPVLWNHTGVELWELHSRFFNVRTYQECPTKIFAWKATTLAITVCTKKNWYRHTTAHGSRWSPTSNERRDHQTLRICGKHHVLGARSQYYLPYNPIITNQQASEGHKKPQYLDGTTFRLLSNPSKYNSAILCIGHDTQHSFGCIISQ